MRNLAEELDQILTEVKRGPKTPFVDYMIVAENEFWKDTLPLIKKIVGNKLDLRLPSGRVSATWIEGTGVNQSDMEFSFWMSMMVIGADATITLDVEDAYLGKRQKKTKIKIGKLTPEFATDFFKREAWGQ